MSAVAAAALPQQPDEGDGDGAVAVPRAVLYLRVSTPSQVKTDYDPEGISIPAQREACQRKAAQMGVAIVDEYVEPGRTATSMDKRPAFQEMIRRIKQRRDVDYIIVYKLSRMNRNRIDDALVLASLRKYNATLVSATESIDATPVGQLMHGILAAFNEYRSAEDGADIRYKMGEKAKKGGTVSRAPLGYLNVRERFEGRTVSSVIIDPERGPLVKLAFERYATGEYSVRRLTEELQELGLRTRPGRYPGGPVSDSRISQILRDRYYCGIIVHQGVEYPGRHEPLVSQEVFDEVQRILDASGVSGERRHTYLHHLKGTVWCERCHRNGRSSRLIISKATGRQGVDYFYYLCRGRQQHVCDLPYIPVQHLEEQIFRRWEAERLDEGLIEVLEAALATTLVEQQANLRFVHGQITAELAKIDKQEENLLDLVADGGTLDTSKVRTRISRLQAQRLQLKARLRDGDDRLERGAAVLQTQIDLLRNPGKLYRQLPDRERRQLNQAIFQRLYIDCEEDRVLVAGQEYSTAAQGLMRLKEEWRGRQDDGGADDKPEDGGGGPADGGSGEGGATSEARRQELRGAKMIKPTDAGGLDLDAEGEADLGVGQVEGSSKNLMVGDEGLEPPTPSV